VGPRAGLDGVEKRKISYPCLESNPDCPFRTLVAISPEISQLYGRHPKFDQNTADPSVVAVRETVNYKLFLFITN
jgi:hypothetical protein